MHRLKAKISRRLHRSRHKEPAADNQSTSPDCKRSDPIEPAKELSQKRSTSVPSKPSITNRSQHEGAVPRSLPEKQRSLSTRDTRDEVNSVKGDDKTSDSNLPEIWMKPDSDEEVSINLWKEAFARLLQKTQDHLRELGYEPSSNTDPRDLDILLKDLRKKAKVCDEKGWKYKGEFVRDYAAKCATWIKWIGDLVVPFAPSQASGPWGLIKAALEIPVEYNNAMFALLGTVERVLHATFRGREYESAYATENSDIVDTLRGDLINVYAAVLEILSYSIRMLKQSTWAKILDTMFDKSSGRFSDLTAKEEELAMTAQACSAATGIKTSNDLQDIRKRLPRIEAQVIESLDELKSEEVLKILEWISPVQYGAHHDTVSGNRTPGTGEWLLQKNEFREWEEGSSSAVLWLRGSPGTGKTFLTSRVIDHVKTTLARVPNDEGFAYFYCYREEDIRTRPLAVARSYVRQLSANESKSNSSETDSLYIRSRLKSKYLYLRTHASDLGLKTCEELLTESLNLYPRTTLVLDAFDECDPASRGELLQLFKKLLSSSKRPVKLFIASRPDRDVQQQVRSHPNIEVQANDNQQDIEAYISQEMPRLIENNGAFRELREPVESTLSEKSQGMFQWTYLQLKQLERCVSSEAILECLQTLPRTLDDTYKKLLEEIEESHPHDRDLALRAFKWVLAAREPLPREALLDAIRINPDGTDAKLCASISDEALLALCRNLLVIDSERDVWRVSHLSVAEFFELRKSWTTAVTNLLVGKACLLFMLSEAWNETTHKFPRYQWEETPEWACFTRTFIYYLSCFWPTHIAILDPTGVSTEEFSPVVELLERFLGAPQDSSAQYRIWAQWYGAGLSPPEYSILAVCQFGFRQLPDSWWNNGELNLASTNIHDRTYVLLAAVYGHIQILRILLAKGGTVGIQGGPDDTNKSTPLINAVFYGHVEVARFLLKDAEADVNLEVDNVHWGLCAFEAAIRRQDMDMLQLLIFEGHAEVNVCLKYGGSPLAMATRDNWLEGTKSLVEQGGADVDMVLQYGPYGSALDAAARNFDSLNILKYLVGVKRANVNLAPQIGEYGSALATAVMGGNPECVQYLIEVGNADVNVPLSRRTGNVLTMSVMNWRVRLRQAHLVILSTMNKRVPDIRHFRFERRDIVRLLLAAGASVVSDIGDGVIVDAIECFKSETSLREIMIDAGSSLTDTIGKKRLIFDEDGAKDSLDMKITRAVGKATLVELQTAMWQQYKNGTLGIEEARYVERMYREDNILRLSETDLDILSTYFGKGVVI
ncbi:hypothetical protein RIB2604_02113150 [Aspergillus luchuensis]|nr:hypothetical protein AKAW_09937 [Aspergillus luchuensis IFO 4308]GAT27621.1 hypothetical protein RIB2604_02113150 [Aspergillus luchuensis]